MPEPSVIATCHVPSDGSPHEHSGSLPMGDRFPIASVTKTLTALLAARLAVDGVVSWVEPIGRTHLTLRGLLTHTAGVPFELLPEHWVSSALTEPELDAALADPPRLPLPLGTWHYSNLGYGMAGRVLERATGTGYWALLDERILAPLGMTSTSFPDEESEGRRLLGAAAPAGDLWSTLDDLVTLGRALDGQHPDVVTWPMLELLLESGVPDSTGGRLGPGLRTESIGLHHVLASTGTIRDRTTCVLVWPHRGISVIVAETGYSHQALRDAASQRWERADIEARSWWWDGQEVVEFRFADEVELRLRETTWPRALFVGRDSGRSWTGVDGFGRPVELDDRGTALTGPGMLLTAGMNDSAFPGAEAP